MKQTSRAIIFCSWGEQSIAHMRTCLSSPYLPDADIYWVTDQQETPSDLPRNVNILHTDFEGLEGNLRKTVWPQLLPTGYQSYLFLDYDTYVLGDIELGFQKAEQHGMAIGPSTTLEILYDELKPLWQAEGLNLIGQTNFNSGVIFCTMIPETLAVFQKWAELARRYNGQIKSDQFLLNLAMDTLQFNPYPLTQTFNYRGQSSINSRVRIWHHRTYPAPKNLNADPWRRRWVQRGKVRYFIVDHPWLLGSALRWINRHLFSRKT